MINTNFTAQLSNTHLLKNQAYIGGEWSDNKKLAMMNVLNPATNKVIGQVPSLEKKHIQKAIKAAKAAQVGWRKTPATQRSIILRKMASLLIKHKQDLALIMTIEQGKSLLEAEAEITYSASFLNWFAEEARRIYGDTIPSPLADRKIIITKEPIGVVAAITPWNFPSAMIARKLGAAIAAGCSILVKPAPQTPFSALVYGKIAELAGLPKGVLSILTGDAITIGGEFSSSNIIRKISFTGSTEVGKLLIKQSASTVKRLSLELGGNAPFIVFSDASIDDAVIGAIQSKYRNSGQTCVCANRIYVHAKIYDEFIKKYIKKVAALKVGNGTDKGVDIGPMIDEAAILKVENQINDAIQKGGEVLLGGSRHELGLNFFSPTILTGANHSMLLANEETFGPLSPIFKFETEKEVIKLANDTNFGLAAYFYARDVGLIWRVSEALEYGMIGVNTGSISTAEAPFGGIKQSGIGREGSKYGLDDYLEIKYMCLAGIDQ